MLPQRGLDLSLDGVEIERVLLVDVVSVAYGDTDLPHASQSFLDELAMAVVERLVSAEKQGRRLLRVELGQELVANLLGPVDGRAVRRHAHIVARRRLEHGIGIREATGVDAIEPDDEGVAEGRSGVVRGTNKIGDGVGATVDHAVAEPSHPPRMLDAIGVAKTQVLVDVRAHVIGVEMDGVQRWSERLGQRGLAGTWEPHHEYFSERSTPWSGWLPSEDLRPGPMRANWANLAYSSDDIGQMSMS